MPDLGPFLISGLSTGAVYVLSGVGLVILFQSSGVVNLAQGAVGALSALIAWNIADAGGPPWVGWIAGDRGGDRRVVRLRPAGGAAARL